MSNKNQINVCFFSIITILQLLAILFLLLILGGPNSVSANTWYVSATGSDINGGTDWGDAFGSIQKGVETAENFHTVLVADGTYTGTGNVDINFWGKQISVRSVNGPSACIIDCNEQGRAFILESGETPDSVIDGFTIINGNTNATYAYGGGVLCQHASSTIKNCVFKNNTGGQWGGALHVRNHSSAGETKVINCVFIDNSASHFGGAISIYGYGPEIINCTFYGNSAGDFGGALALGTGIGTSVVNSIFWSNSPDTFHGTPTVTYSLVQNGYDGEGNIDQSPEFVDPAGDNLRLLFDSSCVDAGKNSVPGLSGNDIDGKPRYIDGDEDMTVQIDMGAYEYGNIGECDFNEDLDVDGADLVELINDSGEYSLADLVDDFGRTDCLLYSYDLSIN